MPLKWEQLVEKSAPDCLIHCVVPADILARNFQFAVHAENSGGMNTACAREIALRVAQCPWKRQYRFNINPDISRSYRRKILPDRLDGCLAAQTTTAGDRSETLRRMQFQFRAVCKLHNDSVVAAY